MPAFGTTKSEVVENNITVSDTHDKGMDVFATAGVGFNYKISKRFEGYGEYLFFKRNLTGQNSLHYDWDQFAIKPEQVYRSFALGVNYKLK